MGPSKQLATRQLGKNGPEVPGIGFGLMELSIGYGTKPPSDEERLKVLDRAWEIGDTFWDTAAGYGDNEAVVGKWFKLHPERRTDIFLATKFGLGAKFDANGKATMMIDSTPKNCREMCEKSLNNFGVDSIDLYYIHRFDRETPVEKTMEALVQLKKEGKIKNIGFSECSSDTLRRGYAVHPISAVQIEYNPWTLDIETETGTHLLKTCRELGVAVVTYSPLGRGFLTGKFKSLDDFEPTDTRRQLPRFSAENFSKNLDLVKIFENLAAHKGCSSAQVVLAWIRSQGPDFFPIPGTKTIKYLEENVKCLDITITPEEDKHIRETIVSMGGASGGRTINTANAFADTPNL